ncbi:MAG: hypothetical protein ACRD2W_04940 [Acidimicrobiales bacterium]
MNVFWTSPAEAELTVLTRVLRPHGVLHLAYDSGRDVSAAVAANLQRHEFTTEIRRNAGLLGVTGVRTR